MSQRNGDKARFNRAQKKKRLRQEQTQKIRQQIVSETKKVADAPVAQA